MSVLSVFEDRAAEIDAYVRLLESLESGRSKIALLGARKEKCLYALKASTFLLLYNAVEYVVSTTFQDVYDEIERDGRTYSQVTTQLREIWWYQSFAAVPSDSANRKTYVDRAQVLGESIAGAKQLTLTSRELPVSGNLDAQKIRDLFARHGMRLKVHSRAFGGAELTVVKARRNDLAHGIVSFAECGRDYSAADLRRIARQVTIYLRGVVTSSARYISAKGYRS